MAGSIEMAIAGLPPSELKKFRAWFEEFDSAVWDQQIDAGKPDALADAAIADHTMLADRPCRGCLIRRKTDP